MKTFYSQGKLLLTGEYVVLDGAKALALPTVYGQSLKITPNNLPNVIWKSFDNNDTLWFENEFQIKDNRIIALKNNDTTTWVLLLLNEAKKLNPSFLTTGCYVESHLTFPRDWGLGSSSTLINNIAQWANIDAFELSDNTFGGSGYDIACASAKTAITYQIKRKTNSKTAYREVLVANFNPKFKDKLYFVHLNKKQNSREGIKHYQTKNFNKPNILAKANMLTNNIISANSISAFNSFLHEHEMLIGNILNETPIKLKLFPDFNGYIKSLGAWGGDFVLVSSQEDPKWYFNNKGYQTVIPYNDMIL